MAHRRRLTSREKRMDRMRNRVAAGILIVFFVALAIFAVLRWAIPREEAPLYIPSTQPSVSPSTIATPSESASTPSPESSSSVVQSVEPSPSPIETLVTENSYQCEAYSLTIEQFTSESPKLLYYVVDVQMRDMNAFCAAFSGDGDKISNKYEATSVIAARNNAMLAINCDNSGYLSDGIVVRGGTLYRFKPSDHDVLLVFNDGRFEIRAERSFASQEDIIALIEQGLMHTFSFGPTLVKDGELLTDFSGWSTIGGKNPRTAIGMVEPGHFKIMIMDGRQAETVSEGVRLAPLAEMMYELGCTDAYNFDGGQSTTLYFNGNIVNTIAGRETERAVTDILYFPAAS